MRTIDLDRIDWSKLEMETETTTSVQNVKKLLESQPVLTTLVLTDSQNPDVIAAASHVALDFQQAVVHTSKLLIAQGREVLHAKQ